VEEGYGEVSTVETAAATDDCWADAAGFVGADIKQLQDAGRAEGNSRGQ